jgi:hypothetical protein
MGGMERKEGKLVKNPLDPGSMHTKQLVDGYIFKTSQ